MYTLEQRAAISTLFRSKINTPEIPYSLIMRRINSTLGVKISHTTLCRVFKDGGRRDREIHDGSEAPKQDCAISAVAKFLSVDLSAYRPTFAQAAHLYFPDSPAFRDYQKTWILDCFDRNALQYLLNTCNKALNGTGKTDGKDVDRILLARRALSFLENGSRQGGVQTVLPLSGVDTLPAKATEQVVHKIEVAAAGNGFSIEAHKAAIKQLESLGLPTGEAKAAILRKVSDLLGI